MKFIKDHIKIETDRKYMKAGTEYNFYGLEWLKYNRLFRFGILTHKPIRFYRKYVHSNHEQTNLLWLNWGSVRISND